MLDKRRFLGRMKHKLSYFDNEQLIYDSHHPIPKEIISLFAGYFMLVAWEGRICGGYIKSGKCLQSPVR